MKTKILKYGALGTTNLETNGRINKAIKTLQETNLDFILYIEDKKDEERLLILPKDNKHHIGKNTKKYIQTALELENK